MTEEPLVLLEHRGRAVWLTLNRPNSRNALSFATLLELRRHLADLKADLEVWVVVFSGAGEKAFCAGADLKERRGMDEAQVTEFVRNIRGTMEDIAALPQPTVAIMKGHAFGGGCEMALACDLRVMDADAQIGLTETGLGIIPGAGGCARLPRLVGTARAKEMILLAQRLTATRAGEVGLVHQVAKPGTALQVGEEMVAALLKNGPLAMRAAKKAMDGALDSDLSGALAFEEECYQSIIPTQDRLEALAAFAEKRPPRFEGK